MNTMLHELGHAARLDHSEDPTDVMYSKMTGRCKLSQRDLESFNQLY